MSKPTLVIKARIEELPTIASFTLSSYTRDIAAFQSYKPTRYNAAFLLNFQAKQMAVNNIIYPKQFTAEIKLITNRIFQNTYALRTQLNLIEGYVADATGLTIAPKDFGISLVRKAIARFDQEAISNALAYLLQNITNNLTQLTDVGFTPAQKTQLQNAKKDLDDDNTLQNKRISDRALLVAANANTFNQLAQIIKDLWADGKRLFKTNDKTKLADYTNSKIIARLRHQTLHTKVVGTITNEDGTTPQSVKLIARPVHGGRSKTIKPNNNNYYEFKGLSPTLLNITVTSSGRPPFLLQILPITNQTLTANIQLPTNTPPPS